MQYRYLLSCHSFERIPIPKILCFQSGPSLPRNFLGRSGPDRSRIQLSGILSSLGVLFLIKKGRIIADYPHSLTYIYLFKTVGVAQNPQECQNFA